MRLDYGLTKHINYYGSKVNAIDREAMCPGYKEKIISTLTLIGLHDFVCCLIVGTSILKLE